MSFTLHVARFGNRAGEHTLLWQTPGADVKVLSRVMWLTDAPPMGDLTELGAFVAGYAVEGHFVVQRTEPDPHAERAGMVTTTAVLIPAAAIASQLLEPVFGYLATAPREPHKAPVTLAGDGEHSHPAGAAAVVTHLLRAGRVVWTDPDATAAVSCVWRHLGPADRLRLVFGAAFRPDGLMLPSNDRSLTLVAVPERYSARWEGWLTAGPSTVSPEDRVRDAFFGTDGGRAAALASELGDNDVPFDRWRHCVALCDLLPQLSELGSVQVRAALQLLGLVAPEPQIGAEHKRRAMSRLVELMPSASGADVTELRALPWPALPGDGPEPLLELWLDAALGRADRAGDIVDVFAYTLSAPPDDVVFGSFPTLLHRHAADPSDLTPAAGALLRHDRAEHLAGWLADGVLSPALLDTALAAASQDAPAPAWLAPFAATHRLPKLHATVVAVDEPTVTWRTHLKIKPRTPAADDILQRRTGPHGTVTAALAVHDEVLRDRAGLLVAAQPDLLAKPDLRDSGARAVLAAAVRRGGDPWACVPSREAGPVLFDLVADGGRVDLQLLEALASTTAADASHHPQRRILWDALAEPVRSQILTVTAHAFGRRLTVDTADTEPVLATAVLAPGVLGDIARDDPAQALIVMTTLPGAGAEHAVVIAERARFSPETAAALGELVLTRRWKGAAESISDLAAGSRRDLQPAAARVLRLFGVLERLRRAVGISSALSGLATGEELQDALHRLAATLYPGGPQDDGLWNRAGGQVADLPAAKTPRTTWGLALRAVDQGFAGAPTLTSLLTEMQQDFPHNKNLAALAATMQP